MRRLLVPRTRLFSSTPLWWDAPFPYSASFGLHVYPDFLAPEEEASLASSCEALLAPLPYEPGHWDNVIQTYKELQRPIATLPPPARAALLRAQAAFPPAARRLGPPQPFYHALELAEAGHISAHVDSVKFSGGVVAGVCLLSDAVLVLTPSGDGEGAGGAAPQAPLPPAPGAEVRVLLPRRCLYTMCNAARYEWAHAIPRGAPLFRGAPVPRGRRISVMLRDEVVV